MNVLENGRANCINSFGCKGWRNSLASLQKGDLLGHKIYSKYQPKQYVENDRILGKKRLEIYKN